MAPDALGLTAAARCDNNQKVENNHNNPNDRKFEFRRTDRQNDAFETCSCRGMR